MMQGQQQAERGRGLNPSRIAEGVLAQADAVKIRYAEIFKV